MRFITLAAAFLSGVSALPASESPARILSKRAAMCTANSIEDLTTTTSASVADCLTLASSSLSEQLPQSWTPSEANGYALNVVHGSCGFRTQYLSANGSLDASQVAIGAAQFGGLIEIAIERVAAEEKVGATGKFICIAAGMVTKVGWVEYEIYGV
jgi:hypothetical protein